MERYANLGSDSDVIGYELGSGSIVVVFRDGWKYEYTNSSAGTSQIARMQALANAGRGLNSFINANVRKAYSRKFR